MITLAQLEGLGLSARAVRHRAAAGRLRRLHRGIYAVGELGPSGRWLAAVLACGDHAVLSHSSAAALWGLSDDPPTVHVTVPSRAGRSRPGITVHRADTLDGSDVTARAEVPCTTLARTLLDLAAVLETRALERAIDRAEELRAFDLDELHRTLGRAGSRRGAGRLTAIVAGYSQPAVTRSEAEERLLALIDAAGLPRPRLNAWIALDDGRGYSADFLWEDRRLIVEVDGRAYHARRKAFAHDRQRDRMLALAGYETRRFAASELTDTPARVVAELSGFLAASRR